RKRGPPPFGGTSLATVSALMLFGRNVSHSSGRNEPTSPSAADACASPTNSPWPLSASSCFVALPQSLPMKRSMPAVRSGAYDPGHAAQTMNGKYGWLSTRNEPPATPPVKVAGRPGVVSRNGADAVRPSIAVASTQSRYVALNARPFTTAVCSVEGGSAADQSVGVSSPYATCDVTASLVCQAIVALKGLSDSVCTSLIWIGCAATAVGSGVVVGAAWPAFGPCGFSANVRGFASNGTTLPVDEPRWLPPLA